MYIYLYFSFIFSILLLFLVSDDDEEYKMMFILFSITIVLSVIICLIIAAILYVRRYRKILMAQMKIEVRNEVLRLAKLSINDLDGVADAHSEDIKIDDDDKVAINLSMNCNSSEDGMLHVKAQRNIIVSSEETHAEQIMDDEKEAEPFDTLNVKKRSSTHFGMDSNALFQNKIFPEGLFYIVFHTVWNTLTLKGESPQCMEGHLTFYGTTKSENTGICIPSIVNDKMVMQMFDMPTEMASNETLPRAPYIPNKGNSISAVNAVSVASFQTVFEEEKDYVVDEPTTDDALMLLKESGGVFSISDLDEDEDLSKELFSSFVSAVNTSNSGGLSDTYSMINENSNKTNMGKSRMIALVECDEVQKMI